MRQTPDTVARRQRQDLIRLLLSMLALAALFAVVMFAAGCVSWAERTSPGGTRCGDLALIPIQKPELITQPVRRFRPLYVAGCDTTAECEWKMREKGCAVGADIIVDVKLSFGKTGMEGFAARFGTANPTK